MSIGRSAYRQKYDEKKGLKVEERGLLCVTSQFAELLKGLQRTMLSGGREWNGDTRNHRYANVSGVFYLEEAVEMLVQILVAA